MSGNRRRFFQQAGLLALAGGFYPRLARAAEAGTTAPGGPPRHIIHLVSDGMSLGTLTLSDHYSQLKRQRGLRWLELWRERGAVTALVNMRSLNSLVTDSAAASSSWGSGSRVVNGVLNQLPDERELRPIYSVFAEAGWKRGLVTTTEITHATPAGFAANASSRASAEAIAGQYLTRQVDVLLGGGKKYFDPAKRKDKRDLFAEFRTQGYAVMKQASELAAAPLERRWLGTFATEHLPFTLDHLADKRLQANVPTLARMTQAALKKLEREEHFILQVEGGRVDHACHNCDIAAAVRDQVAFDEALEVCLEFQRRQPDTLLVLTTDHGTANPGLNGTGTQYKESSPLFARVLRVERSLERLADQFGKTPSVASLRRLIGQATGYKVPEEKAAMLLSYVEKKGKTVYDAMNSATAQLGQLVANHLGVGWTGTAHTADYVPLLAKGPGAERFGGFLQNTDLFRHYLALASIDFRNPEVPLLAECGPSAAAAEAC